MWIGKHILVLALLIGWPSYSLPLPKVKERQTSKSNKYSLIRVYVIIAEAAPVHIIAQAMAANAGSDQLTYAREGLRLFATAKMLRRK